MEHAILKMPKAQRPKRKQQFHEGVEAKKKFEQTMKALFQVPKSVSKKSQKGKD